MRNNIISHRQIDFEGTSETHRTQDGITLFIKSNSFVCIEEFNNVLTHYGYSLKSDLYMEILFLISHKAKVKSFISFFKELQECISPHTTCMFNFEITQDEFCVTKIILK